MRRITEHAEVARHSDMFATIGTEPTFHVLKLLLAAHSDGIVVAEASGGRRCGE